MNPSKMNTLLLASASPRRAELLQQIGIPFRVCPVDVDERWLPGESLTDYVTRIADTKLRVAQSTLSTGNATESVVLAADTAGSCHGKPLVKPVNEEDAVAMLMTMSGQIHTVSTAISIGCGERRNSCVVSTDVFFRSISEQEARRYWASGEPADKAGSYAIQGFGAVFVERIEGSYSNVVGLPLFETSKLLETFGIHCWTRTPPGRHQTDIP